MKRLPKETVIRFNSLKQEFLNDELGLINCVLLDFGYTYSIWQGTPEVIGRFICCEEVEYDMYQLRLLNRRKTTGFVSDHVEWVDLGASRNHFTLLFKPWIKFEDIIKKLKDSTHYLRYSLTPDKLFKGYCLNASPDASPSPYPDFMILNETVYEDDIIDNLDILENISASYQYVTPTKVEMFFVFLPWVFEKDFENVPLNRAKESSIMCIKTVNASISSIYRALHYTGEFFAIPQVPRTILHFAARPKYIVNMDDKYANFVKDDVIFRINNEHLKKVTYLLNSFPRPRLLFAESSATGKAEILPAYSSLDTETDHN